MDCPTTPRLITVQDRWPLGSSCTVAVTFKPSQPGNENTNPTIGFGGATTNQIIPLTGFTECEITLSPNALDFGSSSFVGQVSSPQSVVIADATSASLRYTVSLTGPFAVSNPCPNPLPGNYGCTVNVTFSPTTTGPQTGTLTVTGSGQTASNSIPRSSMWFADRQLAFYRCYERTHWLEHRGHSWNNRL